MMRAYSDRQSDLKWVLTTRLRRYGLRPSGKTKGSALKWVLLGTVPRTVLDATASVLTRLGHVASQLALRAQPRRSALRTASVRQDQRKYCVLLVSQLVNELRPSCKPACQRTASFLLGSLSTNCVLATLRQAARSALRSDKLQGVRFAQPVGRVDLVRGDATMWHLAANHAIPHTPQPLLVIT